MRYKKKWIDLFCFCLELLIFSYNVFLVFYFMRRSPLVVARQCVAQSKKRAPRACIHFEISRIEKQFFNFWWPNPSRSLISGHQASWPIVRVALVRLILALIVLFLTFRLPVYMFKIAMSCESILLSYYTYFFKLHFAYYFWTNMLKILFFSFQWFYVDF